MSDNARIPKGMERYEADSIEDQLAYDNLPPLVRRAIRLTRFEVSAIEATEALKHPRVTPEMVAKAILEADLYTLRIANRQKGFIG